jgi:hypothetical protein
MIYWKLWISGKLITIMVLIDSKCFGMVFQLPLMFTVYVNDLPSIVVNCKPECYVDDSKLYISFLVNNLDLAIDQINKDLDQLCCWCCGNSLLVNPEKTKVLVLGTRQRLQQLPNFSIKFRSKQIKPVPVVKDLGVLLDSCLAYSDHITTTVSFIISD